MAVSVGKKDLSGLVDDRFGRCPYFMLCDSEDVEGTAEWKDNPALASTGGAGIAAGEFLDREKVKVLITGSLGPNALRVVQASGVSAFSAPGSMTVLESVRAWATGTLPAITAAGQAHAGER
ncbi:Dinitrogenase iron-molybdenum cofactor [Acididesulfobacillus acetoxydans]|uniref:Dinitrogenase iron-molybdenum cofactor n=2 Tax=Acididesulfobacillus acetoxydans TaxID=1561005 RepID=A0A8S0WET8_9FIRM|nr:NifB/NifX family molybdenum-iron cluster-binding protein [Acididesulfobacillus acetoxydans]CAA7600442.1 Dinitrogenase iron-molybdenum cofactor [Acididesulfobacillus acetoxydans]CEJ06576.1 Dinitrogenase iron-molybdenum cofactor protein [Acididesulfobacillus acetoxydans]